jgi:hypothetical protein
MKAEQALGVLPNVLSQAAHVNVLIAADGESDGETVLQRLNLHQDLAGDFRSAVVTATQSTDANTILRPYEPGYKPDPNELSYVQLSDAPTIRDVVRDVAQVSEAELFSEADEVIDRLRFYAVVVGADARRRAVFFRGYTPKKELTRRRGFAAILRRGAYDRVKEKVFLFDDEVDCFAWDGFLFIRSVHQFQRIFRYFEELRAKASETVDDVVARVPIRNVDDFRAACTGQLQMMAKLAQIAQKPYLSRVKMADIKRTIDEFSLEVKVVRDGRKEELLFEPDPKRRWLILKLLDDDYLGSIMTHEKYEVNSKSALRRG